MKTPYVASTVGPSHGRLGDWYATSPSAAWWPPLAWSKGRLTCDRMDPSPNDNRELRNRLLVAGNAVFMCWLTRERPSTTDRARVDVDGHLLSLLRNKDDLFNELSPRAFRHEGDRRGAGPSAGERDRLAGDRGGPAPLPRSARPPCRRVRAWGSAAARPDLEARRGRATSSFAVESLTQFRHRCPGGVGGRTRGAGGPAHADRGRSSADVALVRASIPTCWRLRSRGWSTAPIWAVIVPPASRPVV